MTWLPERTILSPGGLSSNAPMSLPSPPIAFGAYGKSTGRNPPQDNWSLVREWHPLVERRGASCQPHLVLLASAARMPGCRTPASPRDALRSKTGDELLAAMLKDMDSLS